MNDIPPNQQTTTIGIETITAMSWGMPQKRHRTDARQNFVISKRARLLPILIEHLASKQKVATSPLTRSAEVAIILPKRNLALVDD